MENDILDALNDIGYEGPLLKVEAFANMIEGGPKSIEYTGLVHQFAEELNSLCSLVETVNVTEGPEDASSFLLELSSFLKELGCPYSRLTTGHMSSRLQSNEDRLLLLDYLISELMAARMLAVNNPQIANNSMEVTIQESQTAKDLKDILIALNINKPPPNIVAEQLFSKIEAKLKEFIQKNGQDYVGRPLYNKAVSDKQWKELEVIHKRMSEEYKMRRDMLITRLDCTVQSFEWSGSKRDEIQNVYRPLRSSMKSSSSIKLSDFLAARSTLLILRKTSDAAVRKNTKSDVNKVLIGRVPDRGGRPEDQQPPPPEMPSWQQQRSQGAGPGGRGGGSGFGGGPRVQGNWNQGDNRNNSGGRGGRNQGFQDGRANSQGYQDNRSQGGYQDNRNQGFQDNRSQGYQENRNQGYQDNRNQGGYQDNRNQGYQENKTQGYSDNRSNNGSFQNYQSNQGGGYQNQQYAKQEQPYNQSYQAQGQGYQNYQSQGYQQQNYQTQNYQSQGNQGYQGHNQGKGRYQNEHDDRSNNFNRGGGGRGRSNYNRGGRH